MSNRLFDETNPIIASLDDLAPFADYSFMDTFRCVSGENTNGENLEAQAGIHVKSAINS